ncbi:fimbria/pilus outer membrane usher protein [Aeromonas hydrophila]|uniref:fimbria/pilus outer membrane usher protein n=1 Tax=Aeromonas hydrophila TaxID=644 RepID=UPI001C5ACBD9|nr:fimbria/pilus outer membrane usher protein [Aeromonas hydrophila]MBW3812450.1 fimbrial biogenesis outer membrane usher protein [Aeromonas hydrophila]
MLLRARKLLTLATIIVLAFISQSVSGQVASNIKQNKNARFNTAFLHGDRIDIDKLFSSPDIRPGVYRLELFLNNEFSSMENIHFATVNGKVKPCIPSELMERLGVNFAGLEDIFYFQNNVQCVSIEKVEYANWRYEERTQRLYLSMPQSRFYHKYKGYISPELWDDGVIAFYSNYSIQSRYDHASGSHNSNTVILNNGFNIGAWRFRNQSNLTGQDGNSSWRSERTYLEHDLPDWSSQISVGEIYGRSDVFDSPSLRGVQVRSDESMLPDELRGYSPVVTGIAETNATVEIRQGGIMVYSTTVAPGPFELRDIPTYGSNGDLEITVIESDGRRKAQTQGFGMLPVMVRAGVGRYQYSFGQLEHESLAPSERWYFSADGAYGLLSDLTIFGGIQGMKNYGAINGGIGFGTRFGSLSVDVTHSDSSSLEGHHSGESYRFRFGRVFHDAGTTLALAGYRYATEDYRSLNEHITSSSHNITASHRYSLRSELSASVTQRLPSEWGNLNLSASEQDYWDNSQRSRTLSGGYGNYLGKLSYQVNVQHSYSQTSGDTQLMLYATYPLSFGGGSHSISFSSSHNQGENERAQRTSVGLSGGWDDYSYSISASNDQHGNNSLSASSYINTAFGSGGGGYSHGREYSSFNANWNGSVVAHAGGLNFGPAVQDGFILAEVKDVEGVGFRNSKATTGRNGFAIIDQATPYRRNEITVDTQTLPAGVETATGNAYVVPRRGSISKVSIQARSVQRVQFTLLNEEGKHYPFGTQLESKYGDILALADPNGRALAVIDRTVKSFVIREPSGRACIVDYKISGRARMTTRYERAVLQCMQ